MVALQSLFLSSSFFIILCGSFSSPTLLKNVHTYSTCFFGPSFQSCLPVLPPRVFEEVVPDRRTRSLGPFFVPLLVSAEVWTSLWISKEPPVAAFDFFC